MGSVGFGMLLMLFAIGFAAACRLLVWLADAAWSAVLPRVFDQIAQCFKAYVGDES